jgi:hypothetical protein
MENKSFTVPAPTHIFTIHLEDRYVPSTKGHEFVRDSFLTSHLIVINEPRVLNFAAVKIKWKGDGSTLTRCCNFLIPDCRKLLICNKTKELSKVATLLSFQKILQHCISYRIIHVDKYFKSFKLKSLHKIS